MGIKDSAKGMAATLRLDSHHAIERFGVIFGVTVLSALAIFSSAGAAAISNQSAQMDSTALYTPGFTTSKTQLGGTVEGVYVNSDSTRSMVLMRFKDVDSVSANAKNYQGFLSGSSVELMDQPIKTDVSGEIVVFGSTGYMAMVLDSDKPFQQQVLNLTMRANSELVYLPGESRKIREDLKGQKSFSEFDQWRVYFNPGASEAKTSKALDSKQFDPGAVYADLVVKPEEKTARDALDEQLGQMQADQVRIGEYESEIRRVNVDSVFLTPPAVPTSIAGDVIDGALVVSEGETEEEVETSSTLKLKTKWVSPRGFDFDWRGGSVAEGYLDDVVPEGDSYVTYLAEKAAAGKNGEDATLKVSDLSWELSNGTLLTDYSTNDKAMKPLFDLRNGLSQAYQDYYTHKVAYQVGAHLALIDLEVDLRNVRSGASVNNGENALFKY